MRPPGLGAETLEQNEGFGHRLHIEMRTLRKAMHGDLGLEQACKTGLTARKSTTNESEALRHSSERLSPLGCFFAFQPVGAPLDVRVATPSMGPTTLETISLAQSRNEWAGREDPLVSASQERIGI